MIRKRILEFYTDSEDNLSLISDIINDHEGFSETVVEDGKLTAAQFKLTAQTVGNGTLIVTRQYIQGTHGSGQKDQGKDNKLLT